MHDIHTYIHTYMAILSALIFIRQPLKTLNNSTFLFYHQVPSITINFYNFLCKIKKQLLFHLSTDFCKFFFEFFYLLSGCICAFMFFIRALSFSFSVNLFLLNSLLNSFLNSTAFYLIINFAFFSLSFSNSRT